MCKGLLCSPGLISHGLQHHTQVLAWQAQQQLSPCPGGPRRLNLDIHPSPPSICEVVTRRKQPENLGPAHDLLSAHPKKPRPNTNPRGMCPPPRAGGLWPLIHPKLWGFHPNLACSCRNGQLPLPGHLRQHPSPSFLGSRAAPSPAPHHMTPGGAIWGGGEQSRGGEGRLGGGVAMYAFYFSNSFILFSHPEQYKRSSK